MEHSFKGCKKQENCENPRYKPQIVTSESSKTTGRKLSKNHTSTRTNTMFKKVQSQQILVNKSVWTEKWVRLMKGISHLLKGVTVKQLQKKLAFKCHSSSTRDKLKEVGQFILLRLNKCVKWFSRQSFFWIVSHYFLSTDPS